MPEQLFRTPPGFYNEYHDTIERRRQQNTTNDPTIRPVTNETSRLFSAPTPIVTRRQPGGKRKSRRKSSKRRKTSRSRRR